eukprot:TRINITY_DN152_c0_g1_i1.p2 TRINITY_DN152_c0_g1~~TRINITY_DN152_c0_g1_i1.p2  ORF type:complete len:406 (+),score=78.42 TRINITY_DN152_c0_g1_i1:72-1289(+)
MNNQSMVLFLLISLCIVVCGLQIQQDEFQWKKGNANAGVAYSLNNYLSNDVAVGGQITDSNNAFSKRGKAYSGNQFEVNGDIYNSIVSSTSKATNNAATAKRNTAESGVGVQFTGKVVGSTVLQASEASGNSASVGGGKIRNSNSLANSGVDLQVYEVYGDSVFQGSNKANYNYAKNSLSGGDALSGISTAVDYVVGSNLQLVNKAENNYAIAKDVALSGVNTDLGLLENSVVDVTTRSNGNSAGSNNGIAVSGSSIGIDYSSKSDTNIEAVSKYNQAYGGYAANAGVAVGVGTLSQSALSIDATTKYNSASSIYSDAIAGVDVAGYQLEDSTLVVVADSQSNNAYSYLGDAIAGNSVQIYNSDKKSQVVLDLDSQDNSAYSIFGESIINNDVSVGGNAVVVGSP